MFDDRRDEMQELRWFLMELSRALEWILEHPDDYLVLDIIREEETYGAIFKAWTECRQRIYAAISTLEEPNELVWERLEQHGLTGIQLEAKLSVFRRLLARFKRSAGWVWIRRFFELSDTILDSASDALPMLMFVTEFKELIETLVKRGGKLPEPVGYE